MSQHIIMFTIFCNYLNSLLLVWLAIECFIALCIYYFNYLLLNQIDFLYIVLLNAQAMYTVYYIIMIQ